MRRYPILSRAIQRAINRVGGWVGTRGSSAFLVGGLLQSWKGPGGRTGLLRLVTKERKTGPDLLGETELEFRAHFEDGLLAPAGEPFVLR